MNETVNLTAYFERIGFSGSIAPTLATLEALLLLHPAAIPFENLSPLIGEPVRLDQKALEQKLLHDRRGGYCLEHNLLLMRMLLDLDFPVTPYAARVLWNHPEGEERPLSHLVLGVEAGGSLYLADAGFGSMTLNAPVKLRAGLEQETPAGRFRLVGEQPSYRLEAEMEGDWRPVYAFDMQPVSDAEIEALNVFVYPRFSQDLVAARTERETRYTLRDLRLSTYRPGEEPERRFLTSLEDIREVLSGTFGINLPPADLLDPHLERVLAQRSARETA